MLSKKMNHFQRLNEVKELKIFFFAQRANTRKQASSRRPMPWRQQSRTAQGRGVQMLRLSAEHQRLYNRTSLTSRAHCGSLSKRRELVLFSLPTPPLFCRFSAPVSKVACLISLLLLSSCLYHTFDHITFLDYNHMNSRASVLLDSLLSEHIRYHMCLRGRLIPGYRTRFSSRGVAAVRARRLFPSTISGVRGSVPVLPLGRKLD